MEAYTLKHMKGTNISGWGFLSSLTIINGYHYYIILSHKTRISK